MTIRFFLICQLPSTGRRLLGIWSTRLRSILWSEVSRKQCDDQIAMVTGRRHDSRCCVLASLIQIIGWHGTWLTITSKVVSAFEFSKSFSHLKNSTHMKYYSYEGGKTVMEGAIDKFSLGFYYCSAECSGTINCINTMYYWSYFVIWQQMWYFPDQWVPTVAETATCCWHSSSPSSFAIEPSTPKLNFNKAYTWLPSLRLHFSASLKFSCGHMRMF